MLSDDLSSLFAAPAAGAAIGAQFRQGIIQSFSNIDGSNSVIVGTSIIPNVPMLATGAEVEYTPGDPVILMVMGNTYMLIGKVAMVGGQNYALASSTSLGYFASGGSGGYTAPSAVVLVAANIVVPPWANQMTFAGMAEVAFKNGTGQPDSDAQIAHKMNGNPSGSFLNWAAAGSHNQKFEKFQSGVQTVTPGSTITAECDFSCTTSGTINASQVSGLCLFSKV